MLVRGLFCCYHGRMSIVDDLRKKGVLTSPHLIRAFKETHRADFMPEDMRALANIDEAFPLIAGQTISQPSTVAFMLELLNPQPGDTVLDIGTGSGWQAALLAHAVGPAGTVYTIERISQLCHMGKEHLTRAGLMVSKRVRVYCRNGTQGLPMVAKRIGGFDKIIAAAAGKKVPEAWKHQLKVGGRMVLPMGESLWLYVKKSDTDFEKTEYPGFVFVPLVTKESRKKTTRYSLWVGALGVGVCALLAYTVYAISPPNATFPIEITIPRNTSAREAAHILKEQHLVRSEYTTLFLLWLKSALGNIQPGRYVFESPQSVLKITSHITDSFGRASLTMRIPEGSTTRSIAFLFENAGMFQAEQLWETVGLPGVDYSRVTDVSAPDLTDFESRFPFLHDKPAHVGLEGYLFPDTYQFFGDATVPEVVSIVLKNFEKRLTEEGIFNDIAVQKRSVHEVLTVASLLEREAVTFEDKRIVAGIIAERISRNMPLQIDASLMYVTGRGSHLLTQDDLALDSPYNTYKFKGLPPGPIANPGIDSMKAALSPQKTPYLYYLSGSDGVIHYAKTFEEHKKNRQKYF